MKSYIELQNELKKINRKPYPAYKGLKGKYQFEKYMLSIDHVQGDPFASPSSLHVLLNAKQSKIPEKFVNTEDKRTAFSDFCLRAFGKEVNQYSFKAHGSGKSGLIGVSQCGQQVLKRSSCRIESDSSVLLRFEVGFPANGRTIDSMELIKILFEFLPKIVENSLIFTNMNENEVKEALDLYEDQSALYDICKDKGWVAFVADGSVLPRKSGISDKPMKNAKVFTSPAFMRETVTLPHKGDISGMAVKKGITLVVGGGYHGKSTLLNALETGIYHHIKGDGREYIAADKTAFKVRAEDGRAISGTDISMFISDLPNGKDTQQFWTEDASGSTSQAANVAEALLSGSRLLLMDEDTSATNFMVRDDLMARVISKEKEPITPFLMQARNLYEKQGVSTIIVAGSSGAYFSVADKVVQMDCYQAFDITKKVREICPAEVWDKTALETEPHDEEAAKNNVGCKMPDCMFVRRERYLSIKPLERKKGQLKTKQYSKELFSIGKETVEIRGMEQIMDYEQTSTLAYLLKYTLEQMEKDKKNMSLEGQMERTWRLYETKGIEAICNLDNLPSSFAQVRKQDFFACVNRYRGFKG